MQELVEASQIQLISQLRTDATALLAKAVEISLVTSPEQEARAAEFRAQVKMRINKAEDARKFLVAPLNAHVKKINEEVKLTTEPLNEADRIVVGGMILWRNSEAVRLAKETAVQSTRELRAAALVGDMNVVNVKAYEVAEAHTIAPKSIEMQSGTMTYRKQWVWKIEDLAMIPDEYMVPDEVKIGRYVRAGMKIPGIKSEQIETPVFSS